MLSGLLELFLLQFQSSIKYKRLCVVVGYDDLNRWGYRSLVDLNRQQVFGFPGISLRPAMSISMQIQDRLAKLLSLLDQSGEIVGVVVGDFGVSKYHHTFNISSKMAKIEASPLCIVGESQLPFQGIVDSAAYQIQANEQDITMDEGKKSSSR